MKKPPVIFQLKEWLLLPWPVGIMAPLSQREQEEEIHQRSLSSIRTLQNLKDRGLLTPVASFELYI